MPQSKFWEGRHYCLVGNCQRSFDTAHGLKIHKGKAHGTGTADVEQGTLFELANLNATYDGPTFEDFILQCEDEWDALGPATTYAITEMLCDRNSTVKQIHEIKDVVQSLYEQRIEVMQRQIEQSVSNFTGLHMDMKPIFEKFRHFWVSNKDESEEK